MNNPLGGGDIVRPLANNLIRPPLFSEYLSSFSLGYSGNGRKCAENRGNKLRAAMSTSMATMVATILRKVIKRYRCCFYTTDVRFLLTSTAILV